MVHISRIQSEFSNFEYYLKINNLLHPDYETVEFVKILRSKCKIGKENLFDEENFSILYGTSSSKWAFMRRNFGQKYEVINISCNMGNFQKVLSTKSFYFLFLNLSWKLNLECSFRELRFREYYAICNERKL